MKDIVGFLGQALAHVVEIVQNVLTELTNRFKIISTNLKTIIRTPIVDALKQITDTFVAPYIRSLESSYEEIITRVQTAINKLQSSANPQFIAYLQYLTDLSADGTNLITGLAAKSNSLIDNAVGNNVVSCTLKYQPAIQEYATNFIPAYAVCIEEAAVNATNLIDTAILVANVTLQQAETLIQEFRDCIAPTLADPKNFNKKVATTICLSNMIDSAIVDGTSLVNTVNDAASELVKALVLAGSDALRCVNFINTDAILGTQFIEESIRQCLNAA